MKLDRLLKGVTHEVVRGFDGEITRVVYDSRQVKDGALFICLRGLKADGHDFINKAVEAGAAVLLVEDDSLCKGLEVGIIKVKDTRRVMALIAANFYGNPAQKLRLIGVTGTNGKTTTTYFIEEILRKCGRKTGIIGTVGINALGNPLEIPFATSTTPDPPELHAIFAKMVELGVTDVVMEVSSHALALYKMEGLIFAISVFTNLTQDHLDFHNTMEEYKLAKAQLFSQSDFAVVNADDEAFETMLEFLGNKPFFTYALNKKADLEVITEEYGIKGLAFELAFDGKTHEAMWFHLPVHGRFNVYNATAAIGVVRALGLEMKTVQTIVSGLSGVPGRIQSVPGVRDFNIFIDYAHSPDGLINIISAVREITNGRVITLFGCGGERDTSKRPLMGEIAGKLSDYCIITSDNPRTENPFEILSQIENGIKKTSVPYEVCENRRDAIFIGVKKLKPGDTLIIAGKGHEDYQIIGTEKHHFDDFETATEALNS